MKTPKPNRAGTRTARQAYVRWMGGLSDHNFNCVVTYLPSETMERRLFASLSHRNKSAFAAISWDGLASEQTSPVENLSHGQTLCNREAMDTAVSWWRGLSWHERLQITDVPDWLKQKR